MTNTLPLAPVELPLSGGKGHRVVWGGTQRESMVGGDSSWAYGLARNAPFEITVHLQNWSEKRRLFW